MSTPGSPAIKADSRLHEVDFIRGFMLLCMALDHGTSLTRIMGRHAVSPVTIAQILPSTTAEIFFFLSGYLYGHVKISGKKRLDGQIVREALNRAFELYAFNALTFLVAALIIPLAGESLLSASRYDDLVADPLGAIRRFLLLQKAPFGLDVLQLYVMFFLGAPLFALLLFWNRWVAIAYLAACWLGTQAWDAAVGLEPDETIAINIVAWQITFFGGIALGAGRHWQALANRIDGDRRIAWACAAALLVIALGWIGEKYPHRYGLAEAPWHLPFVGRQTLAPLKLLSSICVLVLMVAVARRYRLAEHRFGRAFTMLGQRSLACFCASNVGLYCVGLVWQDTASNGAFWLAEAAFAAFIFGWVAFVGWVRPAKRTEPKVAALTEPADQLPRLAPSAAVTT